MNQNKATKQSLPFAVRVALCAAIGAALTSSNGAPVGIAVAAGLYLALSLPGRC